MYEISCDHSATSILLYIKRDGIYLLPFYCMFTEFNNNTNFHGDRVIVRKISSWNIFGWAECFYDLLASMKK